MGSLKRLGGVTVSVGQTSDGAARVDWLQKRLARSRRRRPAGATIGSGASTLPWHHAARSIRRRLALVTVTAALAVGLSAGILARIGLMSPTDALVVGLAVAGSGLATACIVSALASRIVADVAATAMARDEQQRRLIAGVSHDLRNPLTSIQLLMEAITDGVLDERESRRHLRQVSLHVRSLGHLTDDLFELSRLEAGDRSWFVEEVAVDELVQDTVEALEAQARARRVLVSRQVPQGLPRVIADPAKIERVLLNLIENAIRHTAADGSVTVAAEHRERDVVVEVADTGEGIDDRDRSRLFESFYQAQEAQTGVRGGAGLGLAICRAIVEAHGGEIWLEEADEGTRIRFSLPSVARDRAEAPSPSWISRPKQ